MKPTASFHFTDKKQVLLKIKGEKTMLTSKQRAILRGKANTMDPVLHRG